MVIEKLLATFATTFTPTTFGCDIHQEPSVSQLPTLFELPIVSPEPPRRLPPWLRREIPRGDANHFTANLLEELRLETVCDNARCPNRMECYSQKTATFMILGNVCTRPCGFCAVSRGRPEALEDDEPARVAEAADWGRPAEGRFQGLALHESFGSVVGNRDPRGRLTWEAYWSGAVDVPSAATAALGESAREAEVEGIVDEPLDGSTVPLLSSFFRSSELVSPYFGRFQASHRMMTSISALRRLKIKTARTPNQFLHALRPLRLLRR